jgi:hypothetical protein
MAHLFGLIGLRGGVWRRMPLLEDMYIHPSRPAEGGSSPAPLSILAVVSALQSELRERRVVSLVAARTLHVAKAIREAVPS